MLRVPGAVSSNTLEGLELVMKSVPAWLKARPLGFPGLVALEPLPSLVQSPTGVEKVPFGASSRTHLLPVSAMKRLPAGSMARPPGLLRVGRVPAEHCVVTNADGAPATRQTVPAGSEGR